MTVEMELRRLAAFDRAVADAAEFLGVDRLQVYELADQWPQHRDRLWAATDPESFYTGWRDEAGRSGLCANVIDQFSRQLIWALVTQLIDGGHAGFYLDYGCGTGVLSFPNLAGCQSAVLVDVPNDNQAFLRWRLERDELANAAVLTPGESAALPEGMFDLIACIDVLEHLPEPTAVFDRLDALLKPGGMLLHRSPWAREDEELCEHLWAATVDWHRPAGGAARLNLRYDTLATIDHGGLYRKRG